MRTALITGGSRGIGAGIVKLFAARGWRVVFTYAASRDAAEAVARASGAEAKSCDIRREEEILAIFAELDAAGITLDALVNNAGITGPKARLLDASAALLEDIFAVNCVGTLLMTREAAKRMSTKQGGRGGSIVNISSTGTKLGSPGQWVHYAGSKGALDVVTRGLAAELAEEGIRVNAVSPGLILNDPEREVQIQARLESMRHEIPMGRVGSVEEVAEAVFWLCGEGAAYVTGANLPVAGGR